MTKLLGVAALAVAATMVPLGIAVGQTHDLERRIWSLLDDARAPFVALSGAATFARSAPISRFPTADAR